MSNSRGKAAFPKPLDFQPPEQRDHESVALQTTVFTRICYNRKSVGTSRYLFHLKISLYDCLLSGEQAGFIFGRLSPSAAHPSLQGEVCLLWLSYHQLPFPLLPPDPSFALRSEKEGPVIIEHVCILHLLFGSRAQNILV